MKTLSINHCQHVSGAGCTSSQIQTVNSKSEWKAFPTNGLYLMGPRVEDLQGNIIFTGTGSFTHAGITYNVTQGPYENNPAMIVTKYSFTTDC